MRSSSQVLRHPAGGHSLLELLLVLGLLGLLGGWFVQLRPTPAAAAAVALRTQLIQARFASIERNGPVAVVYDGTSRAFLTLAEADGGLCTEGMELTRVDLADFRGVRLLKGLPDGLVWLPNGTGRNCSGGGAFNQTISLGDGRGEARVVVSRAGRVRSEVPR